MLDGEDRGVDLLGRLQGIASVDEDRGAVGQHHGDPGRAGEAGQPCQPLIRRRHVFILVAIGTGNDEAVEPAACELGTQGRNPAGDRRALAAVFERLEAGFEHGRHSIDRRDRGQPGPVVGN